MNIFKHLTILILLSFIVSCGGGGSDDNQGSQTSTNNCTDTTWTPLTSDVQIGVSFIQQSNCNNIRDAIGSMPVINTVATITFYATQSINLTILKSQITTTFTTFAVIATPSLGDIILGNTTITYLSQQYNVTDTFSVDTTDDGNADVVVSIIINTGDPFYKYQWYIVNQRSNILGDINAKNTIARGYSGIGVNVAVVDTSVNPNHEDLSVFETYDPNSHGPGEHGTGVAGIIAATAHNNIGVRGIAYGVNLHSYNVGPSVGGITGVSNSEWQKAVGSSTINPNSSQVDIFNFSFSAVDETSARNKILGYGVANHRTGKGAIYVTGAGNDDIAVQLAYDDIWRHYTIPVSAIDPITNEKASYSSFGAGLWLSTYSNNTDNYTSYESAVNTNGLASTGVGDSEYIGFGGTSGAAPVVSGAIALMLEANASLTWRDVRYILATTTRMINQDIAPATTLIGSIEYETRPAWTTNGAGYSFHEWYGFGSLDVDKAVELAENYTTNSYSVLNNSNYIDLTTNGSNSWHASKTVNLAIAPLTIASSTITVNDDIAIESLEVFFDVDNTASLGVKLTSPSGFTSIVVPINTRTSNKKAGISNFFGESSLGDWVIEIINRITANPDEMLTSWGIRFFGVNN